MEFYSIIYSTYHKGHRINWHCGLELLEGEPKNKTYEITWENLNEIYTKFGTLIDFNVWNLKKGRKVSFFLDKPFSLKEWEKDVKEWKESDLNITFEIKYEKKNMTLEQILKWPDSNKVIQYLKERGLTICPYKG